MRASPLPSASTEGLYGLSSLHMDSEMLRTRPQQFPVWMHQVGQLSLGPESPQPALKALGLRLDLGKGVASREDLKAHQDPSPLLYLLLQIFNTPTGPLSGQPPPQRKEPLPFSVLSSLNHFGTSVLVCTCQP